MKQDIVTFLRDKRILILGYGREGQSVLRFIQANLPDADVAIADQNPITVDNLTCFCGPDYLSHCADYDLIIKSPGVAIKDALDSATRAKITSSTDLFLRFCRNLTVGVTATKGKSTTASLIHHILTANHQPSILAGNIGKPCLDIIDDLAHDTIVVLEISGHQLEFIQASPHVAILLNLYEEHFDHFAQPADYFTAKKQIYRYQNADDLLIYGDIFQHATHEEIDRLPMHKIDLYHDHIVDFDKIKTSLIGAHYRYDICAAIATCEHFGLSETACLDAVATFHGLPHRLEYIGTFQGIKFYNDSIATAQEATIGALKAIPDVDTLILGGMNRGIDYHPLVNYLRQHPVAHIFLLPNTNDAFRKIFAEAPYAGTLTDVANLQEAVQQSFIVTQNGHSCLLSPSAPSYNQYKNFEERGEDFRKQVATYAKKNINE